MNTQSITKEIYKSVVEVWQDKFITVLPEVVYTVIILVLLTAIRYIILKIASRNIKDEFSRQRFKRGTTVVSSLIALFILFPVWLPSIRNIATLLGIFGAGVLIVSRDIIIGIAGWVYILMRQPFHIGNRIEIGELMGDVIDIRLLDISLIEVKQTQSGQISTGRRIHIPNNKIFTEPLINASKNLHFYWNEMIVPLSPRSNWVAAQEILIEVSIKVLEQIMMPSESVGFNLKPRVLVEYRDKSIILTLRHQTDPKKTRFISDQIWREVLAKFNEISDIELS